ncbi:MAG: metallophosphoesterase [Euzebyaceae bacterium]|nr:metallophosphoesterase [Euzebyaceae bacterium]
MGAGPPSSADPRAPVLVGAGDIATCTGTKDSATADLLDGIAGTVFTTGDHAYDNGTAEEFAKCYEPTWSRHRVRTRPTPGNHDYYSAGATAYFDYFGHRAGAAGKGYYSYNLGSWHVVALNSNISVTKGSAQERWLRADLVANPANCTVAYWHHPLFSSGAGGGGSSVRPLWDALYAAGVDVVRDDSTWGVLKLTLRSDRYDWRFVPIAGQTFTDSGTATCVDPRPSSAPMSLARNTFGRNAP